MKGTDNDPREDAKRVVRETLLVGLIVFASEKVYEAYAMGDVNAVFRTLKGASSSESGSAGSGGGVPSAAHLFVRPGEMGE